MQSALKEGFNSGAVRLQDGRVSAKVLSKKIKRDLSKLDRRHKANQIRRQRKDSLHIQDKFPRCYLLSVQAVLDHAEGNALKACTEKVLSEKRHLGSKDGPPHLVVLVALHSRAVTKNLLDLIQINEGDILQEVDGQSCSFALVCPKQKQRWCFVEANKDDLHSLLDLAKVADTLLFVLDPQEGWDSYGDYCLSCLFAQGLPSYALQLSALTFIWADCLQAAGLVNELRGRTSDDPNNTEMEEDVKVLMKADPNVQESLQSEVVPDPMEGEQTWPTDEELRDAEAAEAAAKGVHMPQQEEEGSAEEAEEESETVTIPDSTRDDKYDEHLDEAEEEQMLEKYKQERQDEMFPDEVDTPRDQLARTRFQKYRGLKSFRTSPWDPKENLPRDYARIFQFHDFFRTRKRVFRELEEEQNEGIMVGWYVTVHVSGVPVSVSEHFKQGAPLVLCSLLPHEQKMSVVNLLVRRHPGNTEPIKAKEEMIIHCGFRRFRASPLYSQHTSGMHDLIATGSLLTVNPDRTIIKRIVLSGHPFKILKKTAVVRYMFFNREDILWFKPVELRTKWGQRGHIKEPLGEY
ncbi:hypothetical protein AB205_0197490 [Aquarana catesbeiana]|uniref:Pre-rRNA-processing protein TSR1 homolog n=1 Tax=Aquarana catesbeiana TaxID=8400 RepID=A0A2G9R753_AQUCT|nr:hypothetical protein AB205_0197490 [Aquarana catesbeiana]